jgi:hypothetical protein
LYTSFGNEPALIYRFAWTGVTKALPPVPRRSMNSSQESMTPILSLIARRDEDRRRSSYLHLPEGAGVENAVEQIADSILLGLNAIVGMNKWGDLEEAETILK